MKKIDCFFHKTLKYVSDDNLIEYLRFGVGLTFDITVKKRKQQILGALKTLQIYH